MTSDINPIEEYREKFLEKLEAPAVGDIFYSKTYEVFYRIDKIYKNGNAKCSQSEDGVTWEPSGSRHSIDDLRRYCEKLHCKDGETPAQAIQSLISELNQALLDPSILEAPEENNTTTALIPTGGKQFYEQAAIEANRIRSRAEIISQMARKRMEHIQHIAYGLQKRLHKVMRVLGILEVYLGVHEKIFQLTAGESAGVDEPLCFRQRILYMDEEAAIVRVYHSAKGFQFEGDINHASVEVFDQWLLQPGNLDYILPEKKGVIALRASRQNRYSDLDWFSKIQNERADKMVYLLVRNGDNLYRLWTNLIGEDTLFPTSTDSAEIAKLFEAEWERDREEGEEKQAGWVTNTLLIQGLVDRTEIFQPLPDGRIDLSDPNTYAEGGPVKLIRDAENLIADGHETFDNWMRRINAQTRRGTRIYFTGLPWSKDGYPDRFDVYQNYYPNIPTDGLYTVEEVDNRHTGKYKILYLPNNPTYWREARFRTWEEDTTRKKRYGFWLYQDEFVNYDEIDLESLDYFLKSREERKNYRELMPLLLGIRENRIKELEEERGFVKLLSGKHSIHEAKLWELVEWWKRKVINKRPIASDNAKAWRMIIQKAKGQHEKEK